MKSAVLKVVDMHGSTRRYILQLYTVSFHFDSFRYVSVFDPLYCVSFIANQLSSMVNHLDQPAEINFLSNWKKIKTLHVNPTNGGKSFLLGWN